MKSLRQKKFGVCCYCGQKTKFYKRSHKECHNKFLLGNTKILSLTQQGVFPQVINEASDILRILGFNQ